MAQIFVSAVAHFFMSVGGSKIHERLAHFFIDIYTQRALTPQKASKIKFFRASEIIPTQLFQSCVTSEKRLWISAALTCRVLCSASSAIRAK